MAKPEARRRPNLVPVSEETRRISGLLCGELLRWPKVGVRPMFGLRAFYRGAVIFAMLPDKRAFESATAMAYKLATDKEKSEGSKWRRFELSEARITDALACLEKAYRKAALRQKS